MCIIEPVADGFPVLCNLAIRYVGVRVCMLGAGEGLWTWSETGVQAQAVQNLKTTTEPQHAGFQGAAIMVAQAPPKHFVMHN